MKYLLFPLLAISLFLTSSCDNDQSEGSGNVITDDRTSGAFTTIDIEDAVEEVQQEQEEALEPEPVPTEDSSPAE